MKKGNMKRDQMCWNEEEFICWGSNRSAVFGGFLAQIFYFLQTIISPCWPSEDLHFHTSPKSSHTLQCRRAFYLFFFFMCVYRYHHPGPLMFQQQLTAEGLPESTTSQKQPGFWATQTRQVQPQNNNKTNNNRRKAPDTTKDEHWEIKETELKIRFSIAWICSPSGHRHTRHTSKLPSSFDTNTARVKQWTGEMRCPFSTCKYVYRKSK